MLCATLDVGQLEMQESWQAICRLRQDGVGSRLSKVVTNVKKKLCSCTSRQRIHLKYLLKDLEMTLWNYCLPVVDFVEVIPWSRPYLAFLGQLSYFAYSKSLDNREKVSMVVSIASGRIGAMQLVYQVKCFESSKPQCKVSRHMIPKCQAAASHPIALALHSRSLNQPQPHK